MDNKEIKSIEFVGKLNRRAKHCAWLSYSARKKEFLSFLLIESGTPWLILIDEPNTSKITLTNIIEEAYNLAWTNFKDYIPSDKILEMEFLYRDSNKEWNRVKFTIELKPAVAGIKLVNPRWETCDNKFIEMFELLVTG